MSFNIAPLAAAVVLAAACPASAFAVPQPFPGCVATSAQLAANKQTVAAFYARSGAAKAALISPAYVQHNPVALKAQEASGQSGHDFFVGGLLRQTPEAAARQAEGRELVMLIADCDLVVGVNKRVRPDPQTAGRTFELFTFDTFRVKNGQLTEHWSGGAIEASTPTPTPR